ncbi:conserved uncharacterized protein, DUF330 [Desulfosarcina variabilis str. Montpellier]|uniref:PqiC family protein n=1 Tax=Desulfosarcina variabilis TaxID=2300 RepID=UPI003AFB5B01
MIRLSIWAVALGLLTVMVYSGCRSTTPPVTYYTLNPIAPSAGETQYDNHRNQIIGIRPVDLPGIIDRIQMVTRSGPYQLAISSSHRWADYPNQLIQQAIGENLQLLMPDSRVISAPWPMGLKPDVTVTVKFYELIGTEDKKVQLNALWTITAADPAFMDSHRINLTEPLTGTGYEELAAAHSRVLAVFCRKMADSLKAFQR